MPLLSPLRAQLTARRRAALAAVATLALLYITVPRFLGEKVGVLLATQGDLQQSVVASGKVRSPQRMELASQITGRVTQIAVREGAQVKTGDLLIQLDEGEWLAALAQAKAGLAQSELRVSQLQQLGLPMAEQSRRQAEANVLQARRQFERTRELVAKGFYSKTQLDDAQRNLDVAESQYASAQLQARSNQRGGSDERLAQIAVEQARASLALAQSRLDYTRITAPADAIVLTRSVEPGDTAQPGKVLMSLSPNGDTELIVQIDEKNLSLLRLGQKAQASADAYPDRHFTAEITFISPAIDPLRGSVEIRLRVPEPPDYLRQEMTVSIDIETARKANALTVPAEAVRDANTASPWVLVIRVGVATRQSVSLGLRNAGRLEIVEGITAGEQIIPASNPKINEGSRVRAANS